MPSELISSAPTTDLPVSAAVLDTLAARFRPSGLCLLFVRADGSVAYHDASASLLFRRYAVPLLEHAPHSHQLERYLDTLAADAPIALWDILPGIFIAAIPYAQRRQVDGALLVLAAQQQFALDEDTLRACSRLQLDSHWLKQQAAQLQSHTTESLRLHAEHLATMLRDQLRLTGLELELDSLSGQLSNTYEELSLIYQISGGMKINRRAADFFRDACTDVLQVIDLRAMGVVLGGEHRHRQGPIIYGPLALPEDVLQRLADQLIGLLAQRKSPLLINDLRAGEVFPWLAPHATQLVAVPMLRHDQVYGCLFGLDKNTGEFDSVDTKLLSSIANESAIYLENAKLFDDVHSLMMGLLHSLSSAVDAKDAYTCGHSERVALLSRQLAQQIGLNDLEADRVYMAGLLHDVGKIGIPENVLQKTGRLTPEEYQVMKKHPEIGARILRDIKQIQDVVPGVLHHHERYDGKGYPSSLSGEEIPLMGRIICLADCFDAMTSNRTYRKGLPLEVALAEIRRCAGTQFDPALAEAFFQLGYQRLRDLVWEHQIRSMRLIDLQETMRAL